MADLLDKGSAWLGRQRRAHVTRAVIYVRGQSTTSLPATVGTTEFTKDGGGFPVTFNSVDWLIDAADLEIDGLPTEPARGDRIHDETVDQRRVYELLDDLGGPPWKWSDPYHRTYRVHTKLVEEPP